MVNSFLILYRYTPSTLYGACPPDGIFTSAAHKSRSTDVAVTFGEVMVHVPGQNSPCGSKSLMALLNVTAVTSVMEGSSQSWEQKLVLVTSGNFSSSLVPYNSAPSANCN